MTPEWRRTSYHGTASTEDAVGARVLILDDSVETREHLGPLARWWDIEIVADGPAGLGAAQRDKPDLLLCDISTPRLDGLGLLTAFRSDPGLVDVPVIQVTTNEDQAHAEGLRLGVDDFLLRPFSARELLARVRASLALARRRGEERALLARLYELGSRLYSIADLPALLREVCEATMQVQGADFAALERYDEETHALQVVAHCGGRPDDLAYFEAVSADEAAPHRRALRDGKRVVIEDVHRQAAYAPYRGIAVSKGFRGLQSTPLIDPRTGERLGMLSTLFREPYRPSRRHLWLTDFYAHLAANVIASRLAEQHLRESQTRLRAAADLLQLGLYTWNPQTNELKWDATVRRMWGLEPDAPVDYGVWRARIHPDDRARVDEAIRRCVDPRGSGVFVVEYRLIGEGGAQRWIATRGVTQFERGEARLFYGVAIDITERKRAETALERRVEVQTRELADADRELHAQIHQRAVAEAAVQQLQRLDAIGRITFGVAHDFNNLLTIVLANVGLLARDSRNSEDQDRLGLIRGAAERGARLTSQLLAFSRKQQLDPEVVDLNGRVAGMRPLLAATISRSVDLRLLLAPELPLALVDSTQLELLILNLAINARDAMANSGTLTVATYCAEVRDGEERLAELGPGHYVCVAVTDTGTGIPVDVLPHVFDPFFTTKGLGQGSGLGLAQVYGFARQSGGGVAIKTVVGRGTSVVAFFPLALEDADDVLLPQGKTDDGKPVVLVVGEHRSALTSVCGMLEGFGFESVPVTNVRDALRIGDERRVDLVLADLPLAWTDGIELAAAFGAREPRVPFVLVADVDYSLTLAALGGQRILCRPYSPGDLLAKVNAALR